MQGTVESIMGTTYSKSGVAIASFVALASISHNGVADAAHPFATTAFVPKTRRYSSINRSSLEVRGGEDATATPEADTELDTELDTKTETAPTEEKSLDEKVYAAMEKLGLSAPSTDDDTAAAEMECKDGVCAIPEQKEESDVQQAPQADVDPNEMAARIAEEMNVDDRLSMAAIGATSIIGGDNQRIFNESAARAMIQQELDLIEMIPADSEDVQTLTQEGFDVFMSRRALAFAENNVEDARAILLADQMDAEEEEQEQEAARAAAAAAEVRAAARETAQKEPDFVEVKSNFDPTKLPASPPAPSLPKVSNTSNENNEVPKPAKKEDVVFEATSAQIQELVLESPVPVLLDIYADW